jgi:hypothetical protein
MLEDNDLLEKLNKQSYTSSTQQSSSLTVEDLQRTVNDLKEKYGDNTGLHYLPKSIEEYRLISLLPSRRHEDDVVGTVLDENHWSHLHLPIIVDEPCDAIKQWSPIAWFEENFAHRINANEPPIHVLSCLYKNEGRQCK